MFALFKTCTEPSEWNSNYKRNHQLIFSPWYNINTFMVSNNSSSLMFFILWQSDSLHDVTIGYNGRYLWLLTFNIWISLILNFSYPDLSSCSVCFGCDISTDVPCSSCGPLRVRCSNIAWVAGISITLSIASQPTWACGWRNSTLIYSGNIWPLKLRNFWQNCLLFSIKPNTTFHFRRAVSWLGDSCDCHHYLCYTDSHSCDHPEKV